MPLNIGQTNVRGLRGCINSLQNFIIRHNIDFMIVNKIHITEFHQIPSIPNYKFFAGL